MIVKCPKCQSENPDTARFCSNCATPLPESGEVSYTKTLETPIHELTRGTLFAGRYEIIEELGTEEMGKVYHVEDTKAKEEIALKLIKPEIAADKKQSIDSLDKARAEYERIAQLTTGQIKFSDIYVNSFYMLGKICEQQGDTAKAREHYEKFLDLWKDADLGIAEVEDAKKRPAGLKAQ